MPDLVNAFTSTSSKFWNHPEALEGLRNGTPRVVVSHVMPTDICSHSCAFCSVHNRASNILKMEEIRGYLDQLMPFGLKAVILSGGGNPILYRKDGFDFNDLVDTLRDIYGLEIGLITDGMALQPFNGRMSWKTVRPSTLDKCKWIRISMAGLDHEEKTVFVPDIDRTKTTLGFSYVYHDIYYVDGPPHGKVSTEEDLLRYSVTPMKVWKAEERFDELTQQIGDIVNRHKPSYCRLLPDCTLPEKINERCERLKVMADAIDPSRVFVQFKPPEGPESCLLGYLHPVLSSDGYIFPCDSCVLNKEAHHKFAEPWRICHWSEIGKLYREPAHSLIKNPRLQCPGCVFTRSNRLLQQVADGMPLQPAGISEHPNFI